MAYSLLHIFIVGVALIINLDAKIIKLSNIPSGESVLKPRSLHLRNSIQVCRDFSTIFLVSAFVSFVEVVLGVVLLGNRKVYYRISVQVSSYFCLRGYGVVNSAS